MGGMEKTCSGACCAVFYIPHTMGDLQRKAAKGELQDGAYIADMAIPLTVEEARARAAKFGGNPRILKRNAGHHFTCRHWDEKTKLCTAYDARPKMCSEYPYGEVCGLADGCCNYQVPQEIIDARLAREEEHAKVEV